MFCFSNRKHNFELRFLTKFVEFKVFFICFYNEWHLRNQLIYKIKISYFVFQKKNLCELIIMTSLTKLLVIDTFSQYNSHRGKKITFIFHQTLIQVTTFNLNIYRFCQRIYKFCFPSISLSWIHKFIKSFDHVSFGIHILWYK